MSTHDTPPAYPGSGDQGTINRQESNPLAAAVELNGKTVIDKIYSVVQDDPETTRDKIAALDLQALFSEVEVWMEASAEKFWKDYRPRVEDGEKKNADSILKQLAVIKIHRQLADRSQLLNPGKYPWAVPGDDAKIKADLVEVYNSKGPSAMYDFMATYRYRSFILPRAVACDVVAGALDVLYEAALTPS